MSGEAIGWAFRKVDMDDATAKFVLVAICNYANENDEAWPSHASIARLTGLSKRSIQNGVKKLEDWGLITRVRRDRDNGSETSAMVSIDIEARWVVKGGIASRAIGVTQEVPRGVAPDSTLETTSKPQSKTSRPAKHDAPYSEEFENEVWKPYPRKLNASKKKAWDLFRMLNTENQQRVKSAIPIFAESMRREGRPEDKIKHLQFWISERIYETVSIAPASGRASASSEWYKTATREQWAKILNIWSGTNNWSQSWGPEPGKPGCAVPVDLIAAHNVKHRGFMFSDAEIEGFKRVAAAGPVNSQLTPGSGRALNQSLEPSGLAENRRAS